MIAKVARVTNVNPENDAYDEFDDRFESADGAGDVYATEAGHAGQATSPARTSGRTPTSHARAEEASGFPVRGVAMVLIAVAVLLGLWGLYALTQSGDKDSSADSRDTAATDSTDKGAATGGPEGNPDARGDAHGDTDKNTGADKSADKSADKPGDAADRDKAGDNGNSDSDRGAAAPAPAPGEGANGANGQGGADAAPKRVNVLNNSTVSNLAKDISGDIKKKGYDLGEVGNFSDEILPETTVFFPEGDSAAEEEARKLASEMHGVARPNIDSLPKDATKDRSLTVVLVDPNA